MEALERLGKTLASAALLFIIFGYQCKGVTGQRNNTKMYYVCPSEFIRLGHSCYFLSENKANWPDALFACEGKDSNLSVPARWEDRNLRNYLNSLQVGKESRWIGGIYDSNVGAWKWGGELKQMRYQSFSKMKKMSKKELEWHCIAMIPELLYRWSPRMCTEERQYICQTKLRKMSRPKISILSKRMGQPNEIMAPTLSQDDPTINDVTINPKLYNLYSNKPRKVPRHGSKSNAQRNNSKGQRPSYLRRRSRPNANRRLTRPFPGYTWNRRDPEGSYKRNAEILQSGRTGLSLQQINTHLARLQHLRDRQVARRNRMKDKDDWLINDAGPVLARTHVRTYTVDNNISALHPKTIVEEFDMLPPPSVALPKPNN